MNLYKWDFGRQQCIANGDAGMSKGGRVDDNEIDLGLISLMYQFYYLVLCIALMKIKLMVQLGSFLFKMLLDVGESFVTVKTGFANAQQV